MSIHRKPEQGQKGRFLPGNNGGVGRPKGSRNKLGEEFLDALYADFQQHGADVIARVREEKPDAYLKVVASLMPKEVKLDARTELYDMSDADLMAIIQSTARGIGLVITEDGDDADTEQRH